MQPIDYRNATWEDIAARLNKDRNAVYMALLRLGPLTTRALAEAMRWDILNVRPRVTELFQLGFVVLEESPSPNSDLPASNARQGVYRALEWTDARRAFERRKAEHGPKQLSLL